MNYHQTYYGINIYKNTAPGYRFKYTASYSLAADTLAGIKKLIRLQKNIKN